MAAYMNSITNLTPQQLRRAAAVKEKIDSLQTQLNRLLGGGGQGTTRRAGGKRRMSAASIAKIRAAAKARWARIKGRRSAARPKRKMSAAARARLAEIARARWRKVKAQGKMAL